MKKARLAKTNQKQEVKEIEESYSIKNLIIIILIILIVFGLFYFITTLVVKPVKNDTSSNTITEIDSSKITLNNLLDRDEEEYYVLATKESLYKSFNSQINYIEIYDKYISDYSKNDSSLSIYKIDLDDALNKNYISDELNISNSLDTLKLNNEVLFKIKNGNIEKYYVGSEEIIKALSEL